ncbi:SDR family oxidoreductase [Segnochrobactraceae bacterium EtOH-i3]
MRLVILGYGYTARRFFSRLPRPEHATLTVRDPARAEALTRRGITGLAFDGTARVPALSAALRSATHVLSSIPPQGGVDPVLACHGEDLAAAPDLQWIGYLTTTGVYGHRDGAWVDETTPLSPTNARSLARVTAETEWQALGATTDTPTGIFRLAGIYGPGRNAFVKLADGTAHRIVKPGQVFNRIHVDDIGRVLGAAVAQTAGGLFDVADGHPSPPQDVVTFAASLMGVAPPPEEPFETAALSPMARSFYATCCRVRGRRIRDVLGVSLAFPDYRAGLGALWRDDNWRGDS